MTNEIDKEFVLESIEMISEAEDALLDLEKGNDVFENINLIYRIFHSIKGTSGMFGLSEIQEHMHELENKLEHLKSDFEISKIEYFLKGLDHAKYLLTGDHNLKNQVIASNDIINKSKTKVNLLAAKAVVIDDDSDVLEIIKNDLETIGFTVTTYHDAELFWNDFIDGKIHPEIILSDVEMPNMDGLTLIEKIKKVDRIIPIIFISGNTNRDVLKKAFDSGASAFIDKPFEDIHLQSIAKSIFLKSKLNNILNQTIDYIISHYVDIVNSKINTNNQQAIIDMKNELKFFLEEQKKIQSLF